MQEHRYTENGSIQLIEESMMAVKTRWEQREVEKAEHFEQAIRNIDMLRTSGIPAFITEETAQAMGYSKKEEERIAIKGTLETIPALYKNPWATGEEE